MDSMHQKNSTPLIPALAAVLALAGLTLVILIGRPFAQTATPIEGPTIPLELPGVTWEPDTLVVTLSPGESKTVTVTATSGGKVPATTVQLPPELQPYVTVTPMQLPRFNGPSQQSLELTFSVPAGIDYQELTGSLLLKGLKVTVAKPLAVLLGLYPSLVRDSFEVKYPPTWAPDTRFMEDHQPVLLYTGYIPATGSVVPSNGAKISIFAKLLEHSLSEEIANDGTDADLVSTTEIMVNGISATRVEFEIPFGSRFSYKNIVIYITRGAELIKLSLLFRLGDQNEAEYQSGFDRILSSLAASLD